MSVYEYVEEILKTKSVKLAEEFISILKGNLEQHRASGNLINSVSYERKFLWFGEVKVTANKYIVFLDKGTKPHAPPFSPIYDWVLMKRISIIRRGKIYTPRKTAHTILNSIRHKGTKPYNVLQKSYREFLRRTGIQL